MTNKNWHNKHEQFLQNVGEDDPDNEAMKKEYICQICNQKVSGIKGHQWLNFRDNEKTKTIEICEICSEYFLQFLNTLQTSANLFYQNGIKKKMKIVFDD